MKLIKAIKLHRKLRIRQEYVCFKVCQHTQNLIREVPPFLNELSAINKAVEKVADKLPGFYFLLSDLFGGAYVLKKQMKEYIKKNEDVDNLIKCPICKSSITNTIPTYKRTSGPVVPGKRMSYGYKFEKHFCNDCNHSWEGKKLSL